MSRAQVQYLIFKMNKQVDILCILVGFGRVMRSCALHSGLFRHVNVHIWALRTLPPQLRCSSPNFIQRKNPRKNTNLGKSTKVLELLLIQQCNCRWHCENHMVSLARFPSDPLSRINPPLITPSPIPLFHHLVSLIITAQTNKAAFRKDG
jgi:hypothetical protein